MKQINKRYKRTTKPKAQKPSRFVTRSIRQTVICAVIFLVCLPLSSSDNVIRPYVAKTLVASSDTEKAMESFIRMCQLLDEKYPSLSSNVLWLSITDVFKIRDDIASFEDAQSQQIQTPGLDAQQEKLELVAKAADNEFVYPENVNMVIPLNGEVTSPFGEREHPVYGQDAKHYGVDIAGNRGDTVISTAPGKVLEVEVDDIYGNCVLIQHTQRIKSFYAHLDTVSVTAGEIVDANTKIGEVGSSGVATGPHLHFGVRVDDEPTDPEKYIKMKHRE